MTAQEVLVRRTWRIELLHNWGRIGSFSDDLMKRKQPHETPIQALARLAGVDIDGLPEDEYVGKMLLNERVVEADRRDTDALEAK